MKKDSVYVYLILICIIGFLAILYSFVFHNDKQDFCLDTGVCAENLEINTEYGKITVNKDNCIKHNWIWDDENKTCKVD